MEYLQTIKSDEGILFKLTNDLGKERHEAEYLGRFYRNRPIEYAEKEVAKYLQFKIDSCRGKVLNIPDEEKKYKCDGCCVMMAGSEINYHEQKCFRYEVYNIPEFPCRHCYELFKEDEIDDHVGKCKQKLKAILIERKKYFENFPNYYPIDRRIF